MYPMLPQTLLPSRPPHNTEQSSMCCTVVPGWLSILNSVYLPIPNPLTIPPLHPSNHKFVF